MNQQVRIILSASLMAGMAFSTALAFGEKGDHYYYEPDYSAQQVRHDDVLSINLGDRNIIKNYMRAELQTHCPPGLAKKDPPCIPPGQAKKYRVGYPLTDDIVFYPLERSLLRRLDPLPRGYSYVRVDKDVLLIAEASKKVIDAVTLLSAVG